MAEPPEALVLKLTCPQGHEITTPMSVQRLETQLRSNRLEFHCYRCDLAWDATAPEMTNVANLLGKLAG